MTLEQLGPVLLVGAIVVILAVIGVRFTGRLGVPGLLLYLVIGLLLGAALPGSEVIDPQTATVLGYAALVLILAHGGLTTPWTDLRPVLGPSVLLATVGIAASVTVVALPLIWLVDLDPELAILLGAVLAATDAAAVFSVLRRINLAPRLKTLLEGESGFNDAPVVVLVTVVASGSLEAEPWLVPILVIGELIGGALVGVTMGYLTRWLIPRLALPAVGLYPIAAVAMLVGAYGVADLVHSSGFMAVYVAAVLLGSSPNLPHRRAVLGFSDGLSWLAEIGLFVMLGLLADPARLPGSILVAVVAAAALVLLGRPLAALVSLAPFRWSVRNIGFVSVAGLRGAVPIVFAAIPLGLGLPGAETVFDATLIVVLVLTLVQAPSLPWIARRMKVTIDVEPSQLDVDVAPLDDVNAAVLGVEVGDECLLVGAYVRQLPLPEGAVVALIIRGDEARAVDTETRLLAGDQMIVVAAQSVQRETEDILRDLARHGLLGRWRARSAAGDDEGGSPSG